MTSPSGKRALPFSIHAAYQETHDETESPSSQGTSPRRTWLRANDSSLDSTAAAFHFESQAMITSYSQPIPYSNDTRHHNRPRFRRRLSEAGDSVRSATEDSIETMSNSSSISSLATNLTSLTSAPVSPACWVSHEGQPGNDIQPLNPAYNSAISIDANTAGSQSSSLSQLQPKFGMSSSSSPSIPMPSPTSFASSTREEVPAIKPKRAMNKKKLCLAVPQTSILGGSETKSCPPSPLEGASLSTLPSSSTSGSLLPLHQNNAGLGIGGGMTISATLKGGMSMRRRTSLPKLNMGVASFSNYANRPLATSVGTDFGPEVHTMRDSSDAVRLLGREEVDEVAAGKDSFPYESGPIEILPGLYLGSEQNAQNPQILSDLGISAVLNVAKEVACPWSGEEVILEEDETSEEEEQHRSMSISPLPVIQPYSPRQAISIDSPQKSALKASPPKSASLAPPLVIRPTSSTPNLQSAFSRVPSPSPSPPRSSRSPPSSRRNTPPRAASASVSTTSTDSIHRRFPANPRTGCPAIEYIKLPWNHDQADLCQQFITIFAFLDRIRNNNGKVLVHCQCGVSRSASTVIGYVMQEKSKERMGMHDAYAFVKDKSEWISPNIGLVYQLVEWEKKLRGTSGKRASDEMELDDSDLSGSSPTTSSSSVESRLATPASGPDLLASTTMSLDGTLSHLSPHLAETLVISPELGHISKMGNSPANPFALSNASSFS